MKTMNYKLILTIKSKVLVMINNVDFVKDQINPLLDHLLRLTINLMDQEDLYTFTKIALK